MKGKLNSNCYHLQKHLIIIILLLHSHMLLLSCVPESLGHTVVGAPFIFKAVKSIMSVHQGIACFFFFFANYNPPLPQNTALLRGRCFRIGGGVKTPEEDHGENGRRRMD